AWGTPLETEVPRVQAGAFKSRRTHDPRLLDFEAVRALRGIPLIDARAGERYRGEKEPVDPKAGHIPGALSAPFSENLGPDGRFKSPLEVGRRGEGRGGEDGAVCYGGAGGNARHDRRAMERAGRANAGLDGGAWSDWSRRDAAVATGEER